MVTKGKKSRQMYINILNQRLSILEDFSEGDIYREIEKIMIKEEIQRLQLINFLEKQKEMIINNLNQINAQIIKPIKQPEELKIIRDSLMYRSQQIQRQIEEVTSNDY